MTSEPNGLVDEKLRNAFAVDAGVAGRVSARALVGPPRHRRRTPLVVALALATVALCAGLVAWVALMPDRASPVTSAPTDVTELRGSLVDGVLIVPVPDDGVVIAGPGPRDDRPPAGSGVVLLEGDVP